MQGENKALLEKYMEALHASSEDTAQDPTKDRRTYRVGYAEVDKAKFKTILENLENNEILTISTFRHKTLVTKENNKFYFYDPNDEGETLTTPKSPEDIFDTIVSYKRYLDEKTRENYSHGESHLLGLDWVRQPPYIKSLTKESKRGSEINNIKKEIEHHDSLKETYCKLQKTRAAELTEQCGFNEVLPATEAQTRSAVYLSDYIQGYKPNVKPVKRAPDSEAQQAAKSTLHKVQAAQNIPLQPSHAYMKLCMLADSQAKQSDNRPRSFLDMEDIIRKESDLKQFKHSTTMGVNKFLSDQILDLISREKIIELCERHSYSVEEMFFDEYKSLRSDDKCAATLLQNLLSNPELKPDSEEYTIAESLINKLTPKALGLTDNQWQNALIIAIQHNHVKLAELLIDKMDPDDFSHRNLWQETAFGHSDEFIKANDTSFEDLKGLLLKALERSNKPQQLIRNVAYNLAHNQDVKEYISNSGAAAALSSAKTRAASIAISRKSSNKSPKNESSC